MRSGSTWLAMACAVTFAACLMLGVLASLGLTSGLDLTVIGAVGMLVGSPLGPVADAWQSVGDLGPWLAISLFVGLALIATGRRMDGFWFVTAVTSDVIASLMKLVFALPRPPGGEVSSILGETSFAYPSGHVTRTIVLLGLLAWVTVRRVPSARRLPALIGVAVIVVTGSVLMGIARVASGEHWPSDAVGGTLLGISWLAGVGWLDLRFRHPRTTTLGQP